MMTNAHRAHTYTLGLHGADSQETDCVITAAELWQLLQVRKTFAEAAHPLSLCLSLSRSVSLSRFFYVCSDTPLKSEDPPTLPTGTQSVSVRHPAQRLGCLHPAAWCSKSGPWRVSFILHHYASQAGIARVHFHSSLERPCSAHVS